MRGWSKCTLKKTSLASAAEKNLLPSPSLILLRTLRREFILVALHLQSLSYRLLAWRWGATDFGATAEHSQPEHYIHSIISGCGCRRDSSRLAMLLLRPYGVEQGIPALS